MNTKIIIAIFIGAFLFHFYPNFSSEQQATGNQANPPLGQTGAFGSSCGNGGCHSSGAAGMGTFGAGQQLEVLVTDASGNTVTTYTPNGVYNFLVKYNISFARYGFAMSSSSVNDAFIAGSTTALEGTGITQQIEHSGVNTSGVWAFSWQAPPLGEGNIAFNIAGIGGNGNGTNVGDIWYQGTFTLGEAQSGCPINPIAAVNTSYICSGESISLSATVQNGTAASYTWSGSNGLGTIANPQNVVLTNANCAPLIYEFTVQAICTLDNSFITPLGNEKVQVVVFPSSINAFLNFSGMNTCTTSITPNFECGNYLAVSNGGTQTAVQGTSGQHTYTISYNYLNSNVECVPPFGVSLPYNCATTVQNCPTINTLLNSSVVVCEDETLDLTAWENFIQFSDPDNTAVGIEWFSNGTLTQNINNPQNYKIAANATCEISDQIVFAALRCSKDNSLIPAGSVLLHKVPVFDASLLVSSQTECQVPTLTALCDNYLVTPVSVPASVSAGQSGIATWQVSYNEGQCWSEAINLPYNCPNTVNCTGFDADINNLYCNSAEGTYTVQFYISNGVPPYTISGTYSSGATYTVAHSFTLPSATPYNIVITDSQGCNVTLNGATDCNDCLQVNDISYNYECNSSSNTYTIDIIFNGGVPPYTVQGYGTINDNILTVPYVADGTVLNLSVSDALGCNFSFSTPNHYCCPKNPILQSTENIICSGDAIDLLPSVGTGSATSATFSIYGSDGLGLLEDIQNITLQNLTCTPKVYYFTLNATCNITGAVVFGTGNETVAITVMPDIEQNITIQEDSCSVSIAALCNDYIISGGNLNNNTFIAEAGTTGNHTFEIHLPFEAPCAPDSIYQVQVAYSCETENTCFAEAGTFELPSPLVPANICIDGDDAVLVNIFPQDSNVNLQYGYGYIITNGDTIIYASLYNIDVTSAPLLSHLGEPLCLYGVSFAQNESWMSVGTITELLANYCADISNCIPFQAGIAPSAMLTEPPACTALNTLGLVFNTTQSVNGNSRVHVYQENTLIDDFTLPDATDTLLQLPATGDYMLVFEDAATTCFSTDTIFVQSPAQGCADFVACTTVAGEVTAAEATLQVCPEELATYTLEGSTLDENDVVLYVLYNMPNPDDLSQIIAANPVAGSFSKLSSNLITFNTFYYATALVGNDSGGGIPDFDAPCTKIALPAIPVVFLEEDNAECGTGIDEISTYSALQLEAVYYSAAGLNLLIHHPSDSQTLTAAVIDINGKTIAQTELYTPVSGSYFVWDNAVFQQMPDGLYYIQLNNGIGTTGAKFLKF